MLVKKIILSTLCIALASLVLAQTPSVIIPKRFNSKLVEGHVKRDIKFHTMAYTSPEIDMREIKRKYLARTIPDQITITPPDLSKFKGTVVLIGVLNEKSPTETDILIWLAGDYYSKKVTFFVDEDYDRNFLNDGKPVVMKPGDDPQLIELMPWGEEASQWTMWLSVERDQDLAAINKLKNMQRIGDQMSIAIFGGMDSGKLTYDYDNLDTGFPTWYHVNTTGKNIGLQLSYDFPRFRIGAGMTYQNVFFWTSYLNIRLDEPEERFSAVTGQTYTIPNVNTLRSIDQHAKHRLQFAGHLTYKLPLSRTFDVQPTIGGGFITHRPSKYYPNRFRDTSQVPHDNNKFLEGGLLFEFTSGRKKAFFAGVLVHKVWWEPTGYFESLNQQNLQTKFVSWKAVVGHRIGIF